MGFWFWFWFWSDGLVLEVESDVLVMQKERTMRDKGLGGPVR